MLIQPKMVITDGDVSGKMMQISKWYNEEHLNPTAHDWTEKHGVEASAAGKPINVSSHPFLFSPIHRVAKFTHYEW